MRKTVLVTIAASALSWFCADCAQANASPAQNAEAPALPKQESDFVVLERQLLALHPMPFKRTSETEWREFLERAKSASGRSEADDIVELMSLVALLGDGHTSLLPWMQDRSFDRRLPVAFHYFANGELRIVAAEPGFAKLVGANVTAIAGQPSEEAIERLLKVISGDNRYDRLGRLPDYIVYQTLLRGTQLLGERQEQLPLTVVQNGKVGQVLLPFIPSWPAEGHGPPEIPSDWKTAAPQRLPMWLEHRDTPYWFFYFADRRVLYVRYDAAMSSKSDPIFDFGCELARFIDERQPAKVLLDLRHNRGGNGYYNLAIIRALAHLDWLAKEKRLFVAIGSQTFSAGSMLAYDLDKFSNAVFVGEPTGGSVQGFGDHKVVTLPNSGLKVMVATQYYQNNWPSDDRLALEPEIAAPLTFADWSTGRDPALEAIIQNAPRSAAK